MKFPSIHSQQVKVGGHLAFPVTIFLVFGVIKVGKGNEPPIVMNMSVEPKIVGKKNP